MNQDSNHPFVTSSDSVADGLTVPTWDLIRREVRRQFGNSSVWNGPLDSDGDPCRYINFYKCECGHEWYDQWSGTCNDRCPTCDSGDIQPFKSIELSIPLDTLESGKRITVLTWEVRFEPGDLLDPKDEDAAKTDEHRIWTRVDDPTGDGWLVYPGRHLINRVGYHIARRPWTDPDVVVYMPLAVDD